MRDPSIANRQLALVHALHKRTERGRVAWRYDSSQAFRAEFDDFSLRIRLIPDPDYPDDPNYALELWSKSDSLVGERMIEEISNATLRPVMDHATPDGLSPYAVLAQVYDMARRQALNVNDVLDRVLATLNGP